MKDRICYLYISEKYSANCSIQTVRSFNINEKITPKPLKNRDGILHNISSFHVLKTTKKPRATWGKYWAGKIGKEYASFLMLRHTFYATQKILLRNLDNIQKIFQSLNRNKKQKYICNGPSLFKIEIEKIIELLSARKKLINSV